MEMEPTLLPEASLEERRLTLIRRVQATTIELCMAYLGTSGYGYRLPGTSKKLLEDMKKHVSRVCGLTEKDFRREKDGTEKSTDEKECDICDGRLGDCGSVSCNILKHSAD